MMDDSKIYTKLNGSEIAIIGMAGRFPGAQNTEEFWNNLQGGIESVTFFNNEQLRAAGVSEEALHSEDYVKARPLLKNIELFDAEFFGYSPREASVTDPQHRLFLECVWESLEIAGYDVERYKGTIGVYAGISKSSYLYNNLITNPKDTALSDEFESYLFNSPDALTTRAAYKLNLKGPCCTVQTFCSSSLVAVQIACQSLLNYECDIVIAGGVTIVVPQNTGYWYKEGFIPSPDGHCRPFDADAKGTIIETI
jgi:acyl transferase domain-containing protein